MKCQSIIEAFGTQVTSAKCPCGNIFLLKFSQISNMLNGEIRPLKCTCGRKFYITVNGELTFKES